MNTDTGRIYTTEKTINEAMLRGEPVVPLSPLDYDEMAGMSRAERREYYKSGKNSHSQRKSLHAGKRK